MTVDSKLIEMSRRYGSDPDMVLAGGGNTSYKTKEYLTVKASGYPLSTIDDSGFVMLDRGLLKLMWHKTYADEEKERETQVLTDLMASRCFGEVNRPSVESQLHDLFPYQYVLHVHPAKVNGLTCSIEGESWTNSRLAQQAVWVEATKPGYILAMTCQKISQEHQKTTGQFPKIMILENHGIFFSADTVDEIDQLVTLVFDTIQEDLHTAPDFTKEPFDEPLVNQVHQILDKVFPENAIFFDRFHSLVELVADERSVQPIMKPFTPDHIVYCRHEPLFCTSQTLQATLEAYREKNAVLPRIILIQHLGMFSAAETAASAKVARVLFLDQIKIAYYARSFGGIKPMKSEHIEFIRNWEVEHYRAKMESKS
ncbi:MAG: class II aldolase/adducin family protein [Candidatus Izemoplasmatales bacterium]|nr:class II aldolase/adducin family protein [Candidatus Izemoplasmatales bacterium]